MYTYTSGFAASACGGRRTFGFAERFAAPQRPSAVGVLVLVPRGGSASLRRAITQALRAWLRALRARTKSSPTASKTFGLRPNGNPTSAGNRGLNQSRLESRHYRASSGIGSTICIKCLSGYVTCKHNLGPVNCVCLPCDSSPITERVCTHNTQPSDRVNLFIYYHDLNTFRHLDHNACYHIPIGILCK